MRYAELLTEGWLQLFRGEYIGNRGGGYYTQDREYARQFTQSGRDREIKVRWIHSSDVYQPPEPILAAAVTPEREQAWDAAIVEAERRGYKAIQVKEGHGEPDSIYVFDRSGLRFRPS
jgi:hypothetical protein